MKQLKPQMVEKFLTKYPFMSLTDIVYQILLDEIMMFRIYPGDLLRESEIAQALNVSRTTVANAFSLLEKEGLIVNPRGKTARILPPTYDDFLNVVYLRTSLEKMAAAQAAKRIQPNELDLLTTHADNIKKYCDARDILNLLHAEAHFHKSVVRFSGNPHLIKGYSGVSLQIMRYISVFLADNMDSHSTHFTEHYSVISAIRDGNPLIASVIAKNHVSAMHMISQETFSTRLEHTVQFLKQAESQTKGV